MKIENLKLLAERLLNDLYKSAIKGRRTLENPISGNEIIKRYYENDREYCYYCKVKTAHIKNVVQCPTCGMVLLIKDTSTIRETVNYLRDNNKPICSCSRGYWYATDPKDIEMTKEFLYNKAMEILKDYSNMCKIQNVMNNINQIEFVEHPIIKELKEKFGLVKTEGLN